MKLLKNFDYVVVNAKGKLENEVKLMKSIIDAEKARVSYLDKGLRVNEPGRISVKHFLLLIS
ncbi:hypothetical protein LR48_Vigan04g224500 [Vigna angularis]|uniref:Uncharacterized protein n=1 Tax=Phaseolus angularis TaxID=3914 RepID=A0A0L9UHL4_PHAAN|nr:hypothetical protein LR48_Vigan04g224500 [Vigna angularis]